MAGWADELLADARTKGAATPGAPSEPPTSWADELLKDARGGAAPSQQPATPQAAAAADPNAEPDAPTWLGRRAQDIRGKRDPRYQNLPTMDDVLLTEGSGSRGSRGLSQVWQGLVGASDEDIAKNAKGTLGQRFLGVEKDANGYPVVRYQSQDGKEARAYANQPGLDPRDVTRTALGVAPYIASATGIGRVASGVGAAGRTLAQIFGGGATSLVQDAAGVLTDTTALDPVQSGIKAGTAAIGAGAGEVLGMAGGALWRKFVTEPKFFDRAAGRLTPEGEAAAKAAGLDPASLPQEFAQQFGKQMARTAEPSIAAQTAASNEFKIPRSLGEITNDKNLLLREQQMIGGSYGQTARSRMAQFRTVQDQAIQNAVRGQIDETTPGIARQVAPDHVGEFDPKTVGASVRENTDRAFQTARTKAEDAWDQVPKIKAMPGPGSALDEMPTVLSKRLDGVLVDETVTPAAAKMAQELDRFVAGQAPGKAAKVLPDSPVGDVGMMRKRLLGYYKAAATPEDKRAAGALYEGFNDWIDVAAEKAGDPMASAAMRTARGLTREVHEIFDGPPGTPAAALMKKVLGGADSAEGVVNALFAGAKSAPKEGSVTALSLLKRAYDTHLDAATAKTAWDDIRLAYWMRIAEKKTGDVAGPQAMAESIKAANNQQATIFQTLYTQEERQRMLRLAGMLEQAARKNPNTSWSGIAAGSFMKDVGNAMVNMLGGNSVLVRGAARFAAKPFADSFYGAAATKATGAGRGAATPALPLPSYGGVGAATGDRYSK